MVSPRQFLPIGPFCLGITIDVYCLNLTSKSVAPSTGLFSQQMRHSTLIGGVQDVCLIGWNHYPDGFVSVCLVLTIEVYGITLVHCQYLHFYQICNFFQNTTQVKGPQPRSYSGKFDLFLLRNCFNGIKFCYVKQVPQFKQQSIVVIK